MATDQSGSSRLLDTTTAARALGVTDRHIRRLVDAGEFVNHGTPRRIRLAAVEVYEYDQHREATRRAAMMRRFAGTVDGCPLRSA